MTPCYLKNKIRNLPQESGIYIFKGPQKEHLYIGKAANLKSRVLSYLKTEDVRIQKMVSLAKSLEYVATDSDIEALILESQLIKKFRPSFNIVMRDDKQYSFVVFSDEKYQKIFTTHQPQGHEKTIGPFTDAGALKTTLRLFRRIFPYCTCKKPHNNFCLNYHIGKCLGFCCLKKQMTNNQQLTTYRKNIKAIKDVLSGKKESLIKNLEKEMVQLAKSGDLEKAIELRNKISDLKRIFENAKIIKNSDILKTHRSGLESLLKLQKPIIRIEGYDVSNVQGLHATGSMVTFIHGQPDKNFYRKFKILKKKDVSLRPDLNRPNDTAMLREIISRRFNHPEWPFPDLILIDGGKAQLNAAYLVISNYYTTFLKKQRAPLLIALTKDEKHRGDKIYIQDRKTPLPLTKLSPFDKNLLLAIDSEAHRFAIGYYRKLHRKSLK